MKVKLRKEKISHYPPKIQLYSLLQPHEAIMKKLLLIIMLTVLGLVIVAKFILFDQSVLELPLFLGFILFYIILPGDFFLQLGKVEFTEKPFERLTYSIVIGITVQILLYLFCYLAKIKDTLLVIGPLLSVLSLYRYYKYRKERQFRYLMNIKTNNYLWIITISLLIVSFFGVSLVNMPPSRTGLSSIHQDSLWIIGNIQSLQRDFPLMDIRFSGLEAKYHYFAFIIRAIASLVTGISAERCYFLYSQYLFIPLLVLSSYIFAQTVFDNKKRSVFFVWTFFFTSCASTFFVLRHRNGLFLNVTLLDLIILPNGIDLAVPSLLLLVNSIIKVYRAGKITIQEFLIIVLLSMLVTGAKGPFGVMIAGTIIAVFFISVFQKQDRLLNTLILLAVVVPILATYLIFLQESGSNSIRFFPSMIVSNSMMGKVIKTGVDHFGFKYSNVISHFVITLFTPLHFILFLPFASVPFMLWFKEKVKNINSVKFEEFLIGGIAICGILGFYLFSVDGSSQLYFIFGATPFIEICALIWLFDNYQKLAKYQKHAIIVLFIVATTSAFLSYAGEIVRGVKVAYTAMNKKYWNAEPQINGLTRYEYEGMIWLKNNVSDEEVIAVDRHYYLEPSVNHIPAPNDSSRYYYYSAYSGKQIFLEGWAYTARTDAMRELIIERVNVNDELFSATNSNRAEQMRENNIHYLVVSRFIHPNLSVHEDGLVEVFSNRDLKIYQRVN